jgi:hypothetical protein
VVGACDQNESKKSGQGFKRKLKGGEGKIQIEVGGICIE